jgi:type I restriction-modification system DNA methylase subunit
MPFQKYIDDINKRYATGTAREHTYRPALQNLLEDVIPGVMASNDPARIDCGAPDFILSRHKIDVGYIEAKDIADDLDKTEKSEQLKRYRDSLDNLILTDYLEFRFFLDGVKVEIIRIGEIHGKGIKPLPENFDRLKALLIDFAAFQGQTIKSAKKLAEMMAHKARLMRDVFFNAVQYESGNSSLHDQLKAFKKVLVHDMDAAQFADVYAQTIAYGLFTARLHDESLNNFTRAEALTLIPKSNPFLRQLFHYVAGPDLDDRVIWIVDALCEVYRATDLREILKDFGTATGQNDPILHFYETFLAEYDPKLRKSRGVFYTPEPVVNFIVRAIDDVLKIHFGLNDGLANTSKVEISIDTDTVMEGKRQKEKKTVHKVQMLDVATGTGTFLAEVVKQIYSRFNGQEGLWSSYVENDLLPRLHGFELLMASYAMCHMKLDLLLQETGYKPSDPNKPPRVSVYLTNSLEEYHPDMDTLFASWLSREANEASRIKRDIPIMVALGNPPYSVSSSNRGEWIEKLMEDYKRGLNENNINPLSDDYIKFIRYAEHCIAKTGNGVVAMITNNSFLDGIIHRQMRKNLLETFDLIYIYDLHGSSKRKEISPDGSIDRNVFDIQQGVGISIFIKDGSRKDKLAKVKHYDSHGSREIKYERLLNQTLKTTKFTNLEYKEPYYFFVPKDFSSEKTYNEGFAISELFLEYSAGVQTKRDNLFVDGNKDSLLKRITILLSKDYDTSFVKEYNVTDSSSYNMLSKIADCAKADSKNIVDYLYRPFDKNQYVLVQKSVYKM